MNHSTVPGTNIRVPSNLVSYRNTFQKVGRNIFVKLDPTVHSLDSLDVTLASLVRANSGKTTLRQLIDKAPSPKLRKATEAEVEIYNKAKKRFDDFATSALLRQEEYKKRKRVEDLYKASALLRKHGFDLDLQEMTVKVRVLKEKVKPLKV